MKERRNLTCIEVTKLLSFVNTVYIHKCSYAGIYNQLELEPSLTSFLPIDATCFWIWDVSDVLFTQDDEKLPVYLMRKFVRFSQRWLQERLPGVVKIWQFITNCCNFQNASNFDNSYITCIVSLNRIQRIDCTSLLKYDLALSCIICSKYSIFSSWLHLYHSVFSLPTCHITLLATLIKNGWTLLRHFGFG